MNMSTRRPREEKVVIRDFAGIWANTYSKCEGDAVNYFEYLQNFSRYKNNLISSISTNVEALLPDFPIGVDVQPMLCAIKLPRQSQTLSESSVTIVVGERNIFIYKLDPLTYLPILEKLDIEFSTGYDAAHQSSILGLKLGTIYSKPIAFESWLGIPKDKTNPSPNSCIYILTYLGYIIEIEISQLSVPNYKAKYIFVEGLAMGTATKVYRAMVGATVNNSIVLATLSTKSNPNEPFDMLNYLYFDNWVTTVTNTQENKSQFLAYDIDMTTSICPSQQYFAITSTNSEIFFNAESDLLNLQFSPQQLAKDLYPYFFYKLPPIDILYGKFDGNNISFMNSVMREGAVSSLPDWDNFNDWYSADPNDPSSDLAYPPAVRNLLGEYSQNLENVFINKLTRVSRIVGSIDKPKNEMLCLSRDTMCYSYVKLVHYYDLNNEPVYLDVYAFSQATLGSQYPLNLFCTEPIQTATGMKAGLVLQDREIDLAFPSKNRHILRSMRMNPFQREGLRCTLNKIILEIKVLGLIDNGFKAIAYTYDEKGDKVLHQLLQAPKALPDGEQTTEVVIAGISICSNDIQVEFVIDAYRVELCKIEYHFSEGHSK